MPDSFNSDGLTVKTLTELRQELEAQLKDIYGDDINLDPDSPDGQMVNIYAQGGIDLRELLTSINAGFDPDQAEGRVLDQRVALNGIERSGGTYTTVNIEITVDRALNLVGLDDQSQELEPDVENLYTVKDDAGTEYYLVDSQSPVMAGTYIYSFRAAALGAVSVLINTITTPVTIIAGVTDINNPAGATNTGTDEESDAALKARRRISTAIGSVGYLDSIEAALRNISGVVIAIVLENVTAVTDSNGIPPHSIWCIVEGGSDADIAQTIYAKKSSGSGMYGAEVVSVLRPSGAYFEAKFDRPTSQDLYIRFSLALPGGTVDITSIKEKIVENIMWQVGADAVGSTITSYVQSLNTNYQITAMEVSDDGATWAEVVLRATPQGRFVNAVARITIT